MTSERRVLLIVEDDSDFSVPFRMACATAVRELNRNGLAIEETIIEAPSYRAASEALDAHPTIDFVSIDLALQGDEYGLQEVDRQAGRDASGMLLLRQLRAASPASIAVVVSGEALLSYASDALQKYDVLAYLEKSKIGLAEYTAMVKAVLLYLSAETLIERLQHYEEGPAGIVLAEQRWGEAVAVAAQVGIKKRSFPRDLGLALDIVRDRLDPAARLPTGQWTDQILKRRVVGRDGWALLRVNVAHFAQFVAAHASQREALVFYTADVLQRTLDVAAIDGAFTGLLGQEYVAAPCVVVIARDSQRDDLVLLAEQASAAFDRKVGNFARHDQTDALPQLQMQLWSSRDGDFFHDLHELIDVVGAMASQP